MAARQSSALLKTFLSTRTLIRPTTQARSAVGRLQSASTGGCRHYASKEEKAASEPLTEGTDASNNTETPETKGAPASGDQAAASGTAQGTTNGEVAGLQEKLAEAEKQAAALKDKYLRQVAESRNQQTRAERDVANAKDFAIQKFAKDLIESVDNFERALETVPKELREDKEKHPDLASLYGGLKMTEGILMRTLERHGLKRFTGMGEKFNPNQHEVLYEVPMPDKEAGTIFQVQSTGFTLNGRTIRAAKVGVVKGSE